MMDNKVLVLNRMQTDDIEYKLNELAKDGWTVAAATPDLVYLHREIVDDDSSLTWIGS